MPNTAIYPVIPIEAKEGTGASNRSPGLWKPQGIFEYFGGDLVSLDGTLGFLYWGGRHASTPDNSLVALALDLNHEFFPEAHATPFGRWLRWVYSKYLRRGARVIAISETTKEQLVHFSHLDERRIDVAPLATSPEVFYVDRDPEHGAILGQLGARLPYLLYVGGCYATYKTFARPVEVFEKYPGDLRVSLVVTGPRWSKSERALLAESGVEPAVRLVESPPDAILRVFYRFVAAFVYPSRYEGFGIPLLKARACGAPVIAARTALFLEVTGDAPLYFDPDDIAGLAEAIQTCLEPDVREACRCRGGDRLARYSWDATATPIRTAYERAASGA